MRAGPILSLILLFQSVLAGTAHAQATSMQLEVVQIDGETVSVSLQLLDGRGEPATSGASQATVSVDPPWAVDIAPASVEFDAEGHAEFTVQSVRFLRAWLAIEARAPDLESPVAIGRVRVGPDVVATDAPAGASDNPINAAALRDFDLTALVARYAGDDLVVALPFQSSASGLHTVLAFWGGEGLGEVTVDPFGFPVTYSHARLPTHVFTFEASAQDYGDLRRAPLEGFSDFTEWYDFAQQRWTTSFDSGVNAVAAGRVERRDDAIVYRIPVAALGPFVIGFETLSMQAYLTQEVDFTKLPALDSVPDDATVDLDPPGADWDDVLPESVSLSETATVSLDGPPIGELEVEDFAPTTAATIGEPLVVQARPTVVSEHPADPLLQMWLRAPGLRIDGVVVMRDDGTRGDTTAGDGVFSAELATDAVPFAGEQTLALTVFEGRTASRLDVERPVLFEGGPVLQPLRAASDAFGDDHGPNRPFSADLYYEYPLGIVFSDGVFDLRELEVFEVGDQLLFRVSITDLTDPTDPATADWGAPFPRDASCPPGRRTDLNLQNVLVLIDSRDGGSTQLPENRYADVVERDAWDHALVFDGWWKGVVSSNGSSSPGAWTARTEDFDFCASAVEDVVDGFVHRDVFTADELARIDEWDLLVLMSGHDGTSAADDWGGVRWVNANVTEWQFGGGADDIAGREPDPNIIDLLAVPGAGSESAPEQFEQLHYLTPEAQARFMNDLDSVELAMSGSEAVAIEDPVSDDPAPVRHRLAIESIAPNPFNPSTTIRFHVVVDGPVTLKIVDARGRIVRALVSAELDAGAHERTWNGRDDTGRTVASGVYHAVLEGDGRVRSEKLVLLE